MTAQDFLNKQHREELLRLYRQRNDFAQPLEQQAASAMDITGIQGIQKMGDMTGGFTQSRERAIQRGLTENRSTLNREYGEQVQASNEEYNTQKQILEEQQKQAEAAARKNRIGNILKTAGAVAGFIPIPGGKAIGAGLGMAGGVVSGNPVSTDFSFLYDYQDSERNAADKKWRENFENRTYPLYEG
jgi:hypothetical protein